ncbi:MAG: sulfite exporter TauE/SafE family protein [Acidovorax sp.]|uniref:sulfite exporter TauE/SafE family protein n=1 Tax=Acidovorax sp. TaxID=1872122 RepID=UPI0025BB2463|nr:sulfite exporter TauE/SafE family protein [Acidovorax sp.]MCE1194544.1 sulfite exporter TauE/SafE family protein [Acidovorax sp.]
MDILQLMMVVVVFVLAGCVKGISGMGLPTVAVSLLGLWMPPVQAAALLVVPSLATNIAQCRGPHLRSLVSRLWPGWLAIAIVTVSAPGLGGAVSEQTTKGWLGGILMAYGVWGLWRPHLPDLSLTSKWLSLPTGAATGLVTALTAVFVLPWVPYLQTLRLGKDEMVQALGLSFTVATLSLAVRVQMSVPFDSLSSSVAVAVGGALMGAFGGLKLGERLRSRLVGPAFQKVLFTVFIGLGTANLIQAH